MKHYLSIMTALSIFTLLNVTAMQPNAAQPALPPAIDEVGPALPSIFVDVKNKTNANYLVEANTGEQHIVKAGQSKKYNLSNSWATLSPEMAKSPDTYLTVKDNNGTELLKANFGYLPPQPSTGRPSALVFFDLKSGNNTIDSGLTPIRPDAFNGETSLVINLDLKGDQLQESDLEYTQITR